MKNFRIRVHPAGALMLVCALLFCPSREVLAAVLALLWHEAAHLLMMRLCGVKGCTVELTPFGGMADAEAFETLSPIRQAFAAAAGVVGSLLGFGASQAWLHSLFGQAISRFHLSLAFLNCLPAWPLDGARTLMAVGSCLGCERGMRRLLKAVSTLLGACMVALGLYGAWNGAVNPTLLLAGPYLWYAAREGMVAERVRKLNAAQDKLRSSEVLPVSVLASRDSALAGRLPTLLGEWPSGRYHLVLTLDQNGHMERLWTENELMEAALETIPCPQSVDKRAPL